MYSIGGGAGSRLMICKQLRLPDFAAVDSALQADMVAVKAAVEADLQLHASAGNDIQGGVEVVKFMRDRLLAEDMFSRRGGFADEARMRVGGAANDDGVQLGALE